MTDLQDYEYEARGGDMLVFYLRRESSSSLRA